MAYRLFRHRPTAKWLPILQSPDEVTPGAAYLPDLATQYGLSVGELEVVVLDALPGDFTVNAVPVPISPPTPQQQAVTSFQVFRFPDPAQVDAACDAVQTQIQSAANLADAKQAMAMTLTLTRRLAKLALYLGRATGVDS